MFDTGLMKSKVIVTLLIAFIAWGNAFLKASPLAGRARYTLRQSSGDTTPDINKDAMIQEIMGMLKTVMHDQSDENDSGSSSAITHRDRSMSLTQGVVRIYCTHAPPNFGMPWQRLRQEFSTSTGFVIEGNKIITNAHAVEYGSLVQVRCGNSEKKFVASVAAIGHECDLAVLSLDDAAFWAMVKPLQFGAIPDLLDDVSVVGYPIGGDSLSLTSGVVSRIEMQEYAQASAQLLAIQIDAAINPGNSGGPVLDQDGNVIGAAFQSLSDEDVENIGYVVPVNVINHFLEDVERHGRYVFCYTIVLPFFLVCGVCLSLTRLWLHACIL
jgi:S1-C subfamily serine protease